MGLLRALAAAAVCSTFMSTALIHCPLPSRRNGDKLASERAIERGAEIPRFVVSPRASRRRARPQPFPQPLFSSRTVDVDVIDVTDVTDEEKRRQKEQVPCVFRASTGTRSTKDFLTLLYIGYAPNFNL